MPADSLAVPPELPDLGRLETAALAARPELGDLKSQQEGARATTGLAREYWLQSNSAGWFTKTFLALVALLFPDLQLFNLTDDVVAGNASGPQHSREADSHRRPDISEIWRKHSLVGTC